MLQFAELIAPLAPDSFLAACWGRRAAHARLDGRTFDEWFGWPALSALLNSGDLTFPATLVSREESPVPPDAFTAGDGRRIDAASVLKLFRDGASFSIRGADAHWPPLKSLIALLYDTFFERVHTNVYCSPAGTQGFRCHYDLHDVFVLQVEGAKHWRVFEPRIESPVEPWRAEDAPSASDRPYLDVVLRKGDVLYVPRGHWHYATACDSHSLHITAGISARTGDSFLDWLAPQLRELEVWRRNVPLIGRPTPDGSLPPDPEARAWAQDLRDALARKLQEPGLLERYLTDLFTASAPMASVALPDDGITGPLRVDRMEFSRPPGQRHVIDTQADGSLVLKAAGAEIRLEGVDRVLLARALASPPFTSADAAAWAPSAPAEERNELLEALVRAGLLQARVRRDGEAP